MLRRLILLLLSATAFPAVAATIVEMRTPMGTLGLELYDADKPITVQNFLNYLTSGRYENSFVHRMAATQLGQPFVMQGGGFTLSGNLVTAVPTDAPILNEYSAGTIYSNTYGTIAMARVGGSVNSATSQWFINLNDNSGLDAVDEGFTVFGHVIYGLDSLNAIATEFYDADTSLNGIYDASSLLGPTFGELPLHTANLTADNLLFTTLVVVPEPAVPALLGTAALLFVVSRVTSRRKVRAA